jgi:splicing factor 3A subunit 1
VYFLSLSSAERSRVGRTNAYVITCSEADRFHSLVLVDKTAAYIAQQPNPAALEAKIRAREGKTAKLGFLLPEDPYHAYYRHRLILAQKGEAPETPRAGAAQVKKEEVDDGRPKGPEPAPYDFLVEVPKINAVDL